MVVRADAGEAGAAAAPGGESVGVGAEALRVGGLELDGEVSRPAVVLGIETVGLAAGGAADLDHLYSHAREAVHHRFARRTGRGSRQNEHSREIERRQRLDWVGRESLAGGVKRRGS